VAAALRGVPVTIETASKVDLAHDLIRGRIRDGAYTPG
jgi:hypothetical protein